MKVNFRCIGYRLGGGGNIYPFLGCGNAGEVWNVARRTGEVIADVEESFEDESGNKFILDIHKGHRCLISRRFASHEAALDQLEIWAKDDFAVLLNAPVKENGAADLTGVEP